MSRVYTARSEVHSGILESRYIPGVELTQNLTVVFRARILH